MCIEMKNMKYTSEVLGILRKENMELIKCLTRVGESVHGFPERITTHVKTWGNTI